MVMDSVKCKVTLTARQTKAWDLLHDAAVREILYGGAKGGGKTVLGCVWAYARCVELIQQFKLKPQRDPIPVGFIGRKRAKDFRTTTLESWREIIPEGGYRIRQEPPEIIVRETVKIVYGGLDDQHDIEKFNSAQYAFFFLDQAEEVTEDDIGALRGSLRRTFNEKPVAYSALFTANPRICWLKQRFIQGPDETHRFVQALPSDNPHLPADYAETLRNAFKHRPELLEAYLRGSWDVLEGPDVIIRDIWINQARLRTLHRANRPLVVCDPARFGDDETVIYDMEDTEIVGEEIYGQKDAMYTANRLFIRRQNLERRTGRKVVIVIEGGPIGGPIADRLREMGVQVVEFLPAAKAKDDAKYYNLRAEAWATAGRMFCEGDVQLHHADDVLGGQLATPTYKFRAGRVLVEEKAEIKKILRRSPDRGDCYVIGLWGLQFASAEPVVKKKRSRWAPEPVMNPMAM